MKSTQAIFSSWRKFLLTETERPGPGRQKSRYEKKGEVIKLDGWGNACYYATGDCGNVIQEEDNDPDSSQIVKVILFCKDQVIFLKNDKGWDLPGGHIKESEVDSPEVGAAREIEEETTLKVENLVKIGKSGNKIFFKAEVCGESDSSITIDPNEHYPTTTYFKSRQEIEQMGTQFSRIALKVIDNV